MKPFSLEGVAVTVYSTIANINGVCDTIADDVDVTDTAAYVKVGLDGEYNVNMTCGAGPQPTSIIQLAYKKKNGFIFQVCFSVYVNI